jgi:hypothetical protein
MTVISNHGNPKYCQTGQPRFEAVNPVFQNIRKKFQFISLCIIFLQVTQSLRCAAVGYVYVIMFRVIPSNLFILDPPAGGKFFLRLDMSALSECNPPF